MKTPKDRQPNFSVSHAIGVNTKENFFSSKNRKLYDIYNTKSIQKKIETNPLYLTNYLEELKSLNLNKDSLNDTN